MTNLLSRIQESLSPPPLKLVEGTSVYARDNPYGPSRYFIRFSEEQAVGLLLDKPCDDHVAAEFLASVPADAPLLVREERPIHILARQAHARWPFDAVAIVHPAVARVTLEMNVSFMVPLTTLAIPIYRCEWAGDEDYDEARYRYQRSDVMDLSRTPQPAMALRYGLVRSNVRTEGGRHLGLDSFASLESVVNKLQEQQGFCEIENFERHRALISYNQEYEVKAAGDSWTADNGAVLEWLTAFCHQGIAAAMETKT